MTMSNVMCTKLIRNHKLLPNWIKQNSVFTEFKHIQKIFPDIGLKDTCVKAEPYFKKANGGIFKSSLLSMLDAGYSIQRELYKNILSVNDRFFTQNEQPFFPEQKIGISYSLFRMVVDAFRIPGASQIDYSKHNIVFSSSPWQLSIMSMSGIHSCQSWGGSYKEKLIGSMTDPYCGIVYLTNNTTTKYGKRMIARSIVRYVIKNGKPALLIENPYGCNANSKFRESRELFRTFLKQKTKNKIPVLFADEDKQPRCVIPNSSITNSLQGKFHSYIDSNIRYSESYKNHSKSIISLLNKKHVK